MKKLKCCGCKDRFDATTMLKFNNSTFHSFDCATAYARKKSDRDAKAKVKKDKRDHTAAKRRLRDNDKPLQTKTAQIVFNAFIRARDRALPCISCGTTSPVKYDAGHYKTTKAYPELRFDERNCHKQCSKYCNVENSGNILKYRLGLIDRFDVGIVDYLEGPHEPKRYTIENLKTIQKWFKRKTKRLENADR